MTDNNFEKLNAKIDHVEDALGIVNDNLNERISDVKEYANNRINDMQNSQNKILTVIGIILGVIQIGIAIIFYYFPR